MIDRLPPPLMELLREKFLGGEDARVLVHIGYYLQWFAIAEVSITTILGYVLNLTDFERLEYVVRGMDARVKCERLRQATKTYRPMGDNLKTSLSIFEKHCISLRNRVAHSWPHFDPQSGIISLATFGRIPASIKPKWLATEPSAYQIHIDDLFSQAMWINAFSQDLGQALTKSIQGEPLEASDPKSRLPLVDLQKLPRLDDPAKSDTPAQKPPETQEK